MGNLKIHACILRHLHTHPLSLGTMQLGSVLKSEKDWIFVLQRTGPKFKLSHEIAFKEADFAQLRQRELYKPFISSRPLMS